MGAVTAGGLAWNVETWGPRAPGPPLLLLHGFTGRGRGWEAFAARFAGSRLCLAPDLPGHGSSGAPPEGFGLVQAAAGLRDLLEAYGASVAAVVGYSMGGRLALHLAVRHPERVERLVLVGASPGIEDDEERRARGREDEAWALRIEERGMEPFVRDWMAQPLFEGMRSLSGARLEEIRREKLSHEPSRLAAAMRALGVAWQAPLQAALARITAPVLLVAGERDEKYRGVAAAMAARLPNARVAVIPGAGHAPQIEAPEEFLAAVAPFLEAAVPTEG